MSEEAFLFGKEKRKSASSIGTESSKNKNDSDTDAFSGTTSTKRNNSDARQENKKWLETPGSTEQETNDSDSEPFFKSGKKATSIKETPIQKAGEVLRSIGLTAKEFEPASSAEFAFGSTLNHAKESNRPGIVPFQKSLTVGNSKELKAILDDEEDPFSGFMPITESARPPVESSFSKFAVSSKKVTSSFGAFSDTPLEPLSPLNSPPRAPMGGRSTSISTQENVKPAVFQSNSFVNSTFPTYAAVSDDKIEHNHFNNASSRMRVSEVAVKHVRNVLQANLQSNSRIQNSSRPILLDDDLSTRSYLSVKEDSLNRQQTGFASQSVSVATQSVSAPSCRETIHQSQVPCPLRNLLKNLFREDSVRDFLKVVALDQYNAILEEIALHPY